MKYVLTAILLLSSLASASDKACVIVARHEHKFGENMSHWVAHKSFDWVEGAFPHGMKFRNDLGDKQVRQIQDAGGKVVVLPAEYKLPDLEDARSSCKKFQEGR